MKTIHGPGKGQHWDSGESKTAARWQSFYLYYHENQDRLLTQCVLPLVGTLWKQGLCDRFFFIRYLLGGPHLRLRFRALSESTGLEDVVERSVAGFLSREPSRVSLPEAEILAVNQRIGSLDPTELEATTACFPDNHLRVVEFCPEVDRYGGAFLLNHSLEVFAVSSACSLLLLRAMGDQGRGVRLLQTLRLLFRQGVASARSLGELSAILGYGEGYQFGKTQFWAEKAGKEFQRQRGALLALLSGELDPSRSESVSASGADPFAAIELGSKDLQAAVAERAGDDSWLRICSSQLHMTANRMGLSNSEEAYLSALFPLLAAETNIQEALRAKLESPLPRSDPGASWLEPWLREVYL
jgi:Lantibiotic biosynthesis dehydratase C-term